MKYATIAALVAVASAKDFDSGCKGGMKFEMFKDEKCAEAAEGSKTMTQEEIDTYEKGGECAKMGQGSFKASCVAEGLKYEMFADAECKKSAASKTLAWGECEKAPVGPDSLKLTNAVALKTAAVAMVAFAASQF